MHRHPARRPARPPIATALPRRDWMLAAAAGLAGTTAALGRGAASPGRAAPAAMVGPGAMTGWWTWRGPLGNNIAVSNEFARDTISDEAIHWQTPVPGRGHSSPIVTDEAIYLTSCDQAAGTQSVLAFDRRDGQPLWNEVVHQGGVPASNHRKNTEATPTAAFDGSRLLTIFYNADAVWATATSPAGERLWQRAVGPYAPIKYKFGYGASPTIYHETAIIVSDFDGESFLTALSMHDGSPVWRVDRHHYTNYSSPIVAHLAGRDQLLLSGGQKITSYDPASGQLLWSAPATATATCGTVVWDEDFIYASGGYPQSETACVAADGSGEVIWTNNQQCYAQSMLTTGGFLYAVTDQGIAYCWRGADGEVMWRHRLGGNYSSSPLLVGQRIYVFNERGQAFTFAATPERFESLGNGQLGDEVYATPAVVGDTLYLRVARDEPHGRQEYLIAVR